MSDAVSFWLDNKMVSARKVAEIDDQLLVDYRGKFHVIRNGSAIMKGSKPLHYSKSSLPAIWKRAMRGETPTIKPAEPPDEILPMTSVTKRIRPRTELEKPPMPEPLTPPPVAAARLQEEAKPSRPSKKTDSRSAGQTVVPAHCPYCNQKHELAVEKGRNGKPFFVSCTKCTTEFAVRFVPVTVFQAQVAGFR